MRYLLPLVLASCLLFTGCYQAQMTTGKEASDTVVEEPWAPSFLYGLVPAEIDVSDECTNGIAMAEREMSFLNMVVSGLTVSLFTPQNVTVTCAADGAMSDAQSMPESLDVTLPTDQSNADIQDLLSTTALQSTIANKPVRIHIPAE